MKKILTGFLSIGVVFSLLGNTSYASESALTMDEVDKVLINFGYDEEDLAYYEEKNKIELAEAIQNNPENVEMTKTYLRVDNIGIIEYYTNTSDKVLSEDVSEEKIKGIRDNLNKLNSQSDEELMRNYDISKGEAKLIKEALKKKTNYKAPEKFDKKEVTTSGTIASSDLSFTMSVVNNSTSTAPNYRVSLNHNWKNPFFVDMFSDNVAAAWGGNLDVKEIGGLIYYVNGNWWTGSYGTAWGSIAPSSTVTPNTGIVFDFAQSKDGYTAQARGGNYWFTVFQNKKQGYSTSIVSQYAHKILTVSNVTVSNAPSIVLGSGKDVTPQQKTNVNY